MERLINNSTIDQERTFDNSMDSPLTKLYTTNKSPEERVGSAHNSLNMN